ncbi:hypothetical protein C8F01DRAFT_1120325 [Mycena amicta]|nr:hypothetical protein C8F01DRAFT_1120325 [Mycena amicta]
MASTLQARLLTQSPDAPKKTWNASRVLVQHGQSLLDRIGGRGKSLLERMDIDDNDSTRLSALDDGEASEPATPHESSVPATPLLNGHFISPRKEDHPTAPPPNASSAALQQRIGNVLNHAVYRNTLLRVNEPIDVRTLQRRVEWTITSSAVEKFGEEMKKKRRRRFWRSAKGGIVSFDALWPPGLDAHTRSFASTSALSPRRSLEPMDKSVPTAPKAMRAPGTPSLKGKERADGPPDDFGRVPRENISPNSGRRRSRSPPSIRRDSRYTNNSRSPIRRPPSRSPPRRRYSSERNFNGRPSRSPSVPRERRIFSTPHRLRPPSRSRSPILNSRHPLEKRRGYSLADRRGSRSPPHVRRKFSPGYNPSPRSRSRYRSRSRPRQRSHSLDSSISQSRRGRQFVDNHHNGGPTLTSTVSPNSHRFPERRMHSPETPSTSYGPPPPPTTASLPPPAPVIPPNPCNNVPGIWFAKVGAPRPIVTKREFVVEPGMAAVWDIPSGSERATQPKLSVQLLCLSTVAVSACSRVFRRKLLGAETEHTFILCCLPRKAGPEPDDIDALFKLDAPSDNPLFQFSIL